MKRKLFLLVLVLGLTACNQPQSGDEAGTDSLRQQDDKGYDRAYSLRQFHFPEDHGPHRDLRDEWWYITGNLDGPDGRRFGFQITFFRQGLKKEEAKRASHWASNEAYMAHFAITDAAGKTYTSFQRFGRGAAGVAGARAQPFKVWVDNWRLEGQGADFPWHLQARQEGMGLNLQFTPDGPIVLNGEQGLSRKNATPGNASYYYSIPRLKTSGSLTLKGQNYPVTGLSWLDREWSTSMLGGDQAGWDWFALQLYDGSSLMVSRLRDFQGQSGLASGGTYTSAQGEVIHLSHQDIDIQVLDTWDSPAGGRYPARWRVTLKSPARSFEIKPILADQEFRHDARYWEGAVDVTDPATGRPAGRGYVELTGYALKHP